MFYPTDCAHDNCCYPANHPTAPCTLKGRAQCSPSEGPCCTPDCKIVSRFDRQTCHPDSECSYEAVCDGKTSKCPTPDPKQDSTPCESGSKVPKTAYYVELNTRSTFLQHFCSLSALKKMNALVLWCTLGADQIPQKI